MRHPLINLWFSPRETTQYLIEHTNEKKALMVIMLACSFFSLFQVIFTILGPWLTEWWRTPAGTETVSPGFPYFVIAFLVLISTPIASWVFFVLFPVSLHRFGLWLGGRATIHELRIAIGWGAVPLVVVMILAMLSVYPFSWLITLNEEAFFTAGFDQQPAVYETIGLIAELVKYGILLVGGIIYAKMVAAAEKFSAWRAFGALCFAGILPAAAVIFLLVFLSSLLAIIFG